MNKVVVLIQGPIYTDFNGFSTFDVLRSLSASQLRSSLYVVCSVWEDEPPELIEELTRYADRVVSCSKPCDPGSGNRNLQRHSVSYTLAAIEHLGFKYVLKTRSDIILSDKFLRSLIRLSAGDFQRVLVTDVYTTLENFHISDLIVFSTFENIKYWFDPREVYYQDAYSPEIQFSRVFIRNKKLNYTMRFEDYLAFLRDWIELRSLDKEGLVWFRRSKEKVAPEDHARVNPHIHNQASSPTLKRDISSELPDALLLGRVYRTLRAKLPWGLRVFLFYLLKTKLVISLQYDKELGPVRNRIITTRFHRFLRRTKIPLSVIATVLLLADEITSFMVRTLPLPRVEYIYYTVDPKMSEHAKPVGNEVSAQSPS